MGVTEDSVLKLLGGAGALGIFAYLAHMAAKAFGIHLDKERAARAAEGALYAAAFRDVAADVKAGLADVKSGMDSIRNAMVEMDRGHVEQNRQTFLQVFGVIEKQNAATSGTMQQVAALDGRVGRIESGMADVKHTLEDHGDKFDAILRGLPAAQGRGPKREGHDAALPPPQTRREP